MHHVNITLDTRTGGWIGEFFPDSSNIRIEQLWLAEYFILFYFIFVLFCSTLNNNPEKSQGFGLYLYNGAKN